jgi:hypothetical protein
MEYLLKDEDFDFVKARADFEKFFRLLAFILGEKVFKKYNGSKFKGSFLQTAFKAIVIGLAYHIDSYTLGQDEALIEAKIKAMWQETAFLENVSGVNAKARLPRIAAFSNFVQ